jgi:cytoskeletal protein CcmA (bactofilin family)
MRYDPRFAIQENLDSSGRRDSVGLLSSKGRGDKATSGATLKKGSAPADEDQAKSRSKGTVSQTGVSGSDGEQSARKRESASGTKPDAQGGNSMATIGQSIIFKGEMTGDEDLEIDGQVEGNVDLKNHQLTIGPNGILKAEVIAKSIIVIGKVTGNLVATERIEVQATGLVEGDVRAPRLNVQEGAVLNGGIDMSPSGASAGKKPAAQASSPGSNASQDAPIQSV